MPAAFLRLSQSLQYCGQVIPACTFPAALSAFHSLPQARSRAYSACLGSAGFLAAGFGAAAGAAVVVVAAGVAASVLHFATKSFSVIFAASFAALFARHSSWQAFTVFFCAKEGVAESARPAKMRKKHPRNSGRFSIFKLQHSMSYLKLSALVSGCCCATKPTPAWPVQRSCSTRSGARHFSSPPTCTAWRSVLRWSGTPSG